MTVPSNRLLRNVLRALVDEYGPNDVYQTLTKILDNSTGNDFYFEEKRKSRRDGQLNDTIKPKRLNATEQAKKVLHHSQEPEALLNLASRFDRKEFLPHIADIKEFLVRMGAAGEIVRDRMDGFRHVLLVLAQLPSDRLRKLSDVNSPSGPAQLAPLAEAIRTAGDAMRRSDYSLPPQAEGPQHDDKSVPEETVRVGKGYESLPSVLPTVEGRSTKGSSDLPVEQSDANFKDGEKATSRDKIKMNTTKSEPTKPKE